MCQRHDRTGESLFNDGVGGVIFTVPVVVSAGAKGDDINLLHVGGVFFIEALGGAALGLIAGYLAYRAMRAIDDYPIEVLAATYAVVLFTIVVQGLSLHALAKRVVN